MNEIYKFNNTKNNKDFGSVSKEDKDSNEELFLKESIQRFGVGHIGRVEICFEDIPSRERQEIIEAYNDSIKKIKILLEDFDSLLNQTDVEEKEQKVFNDFRNGIETALFRALNQIIYHGKVSPREALDAFDEFAMLLETVHESLVHPKILNTRMYKDAAIYSIKPPEGAGGSMEHRKITEISTLFSKEHIAWNVASESRYDARGVTKSGIRLDYGPLYKEESNKVNNAKTEWVTSIDISGFHLDKIFNQYSKRGHHFTKIFNYKMGLIIPGLSKVLTNYFSTKG